MANPEVHKKQIKIKQMNNGCVSIGLNLPP